MSFPANTGSSSPGWSPEQRKAIDHWLRHQDRSLSSPRLTIPARTKGTSALASYGQEQIWFHSRLAARHLIYNEPITLQFRGFLQVDALQKSIDAFVQRHEAWRTTFAFESGALRQIIHPHVTISIPFTDLSGLSKGRAAYVASDIARNDAILPFDLSFGPLLRCRLVKLDSQLHRLYICLHHIIFDGATISNIFLPELISLYSSYEKGVVAQLPVLVRQYGDYAAWHRHWANSDEVVSQADYWRSNLSDLRELDLPTDRPRTKRQGFRGAQHRFTVPAQTALALKRISDTCDATVFMVLLATLAVQLKRWTGADDLPIGGASSGRKWPETGGIAGFFVNTVVFRIDGSEDPTFRQIVERVKESVIGAMAHDEVPFSTVVRQNQVLRDSSRHPLFQVMFTLQPLLPKVPSAWEFTHMDIETGATKFDLHLDMDQGNAGFAARFIYSVDLFEPRTVRRLANEWLGIAEAAAAEPDVAISRLTSARGNKIMRKIWKLLATRRAGRSRKGECSEKLLGN